jgi:hypothetical protein
MALIDAVISDLLLTRLAGLVFSPAVPIANPGVAFDPADHETYLEASVLFNAPTDTGFISASTEFKGILQVMVVTKTMEGIIPPAEIADTVRNHFARGTRLVGEGVVVKVPSTPAVNAPITTADHINIPVSIPYQCFRRD